MNRLRLTGRFQLRSGYTLVELMVAMSSATLLFGGLASSIYISSRALQQDGGVSVQRLEADEVLDDVLADVKLALHFFERTADAATFSVPDRDGDGDPEMIRYAWSGTPGDPLTYEYNGSTAVNLVEDVHNFNLTALTRTVTAPPLTTGPPPGGANLLFVVTSVTSPTSQEVTRKTLLESWGYTVTLIADFDSQASYDAAIAANDVAYISEVILASNVGTKLTNATIGVVNGEGELTDELGFSSGKTWPAQFEVSIANATHYITEEFATGPLTISTSAQSMLAVSGDLAPDLEVLGGYGSAPTLVWLRSGANLYGGGTAAGRRVQLPWGGSFFDFSLLTADGRTLLRRSIEWAAGAGDDDPPPALLLVVTDLATPTSEENNKRVLIESWGYDVTLIGDSDSQADFDAAVAANDVAYICSQVDDGILDTKLVDGAIGVVLEERKLMSEFGIATAALNAPVTELEVADNTHYITSGFSLGALPIFNSAVDAIYPGSPLAPDLAPLGRIGSELCLLTIPKDGSLLGGGTAAGRRVQLPWGNDSFDSSALTANGQTIMQRAIEWAAGAGNTSPAPDANFGYETQFANNTGGLNGVQVGTQVTLPENGTLNSITAYINPGGGSKNFRFAIYTDNAGEPGNLIVETAVNAQGGGTGWKTVSVPPTALTSGTYWLALSFSHNTQKYYYSASGGNTRHKLHAAVQNGFISVWPGSTTPYSRQVAIYGTYTPDN